MMEVIGVGIGAEFKSLKPGDLFLGNRSGETPLACIKIAPPKDEDDDEWCVVLSPPERETEPSVVVFASWFVAPKVLHLDQVRLVLDFGSKGITFDYEARPGDVIVNAKQQHYMAVRLHRDLKFLDMKSGKLLAGRLGGSPWPICRKWSLQWEAPDLTEVPGWMLPKKGGGLATA